MIGRLIARARSWTRATVTAARARLLPGHGEAPASPAPGDGTPLDQSVEHARLRHTAPATYLLNEHGEAAVRRLNAATGNGVPMDSLLVAARWWQLENYLRQLLYIELRARRGPGWAEPLRAVTSQRMNDARADAYMASPDDQHLLAYTDVGDLFRLIDAHWNDCHHGIGLPRDVWRGRTSELRRIRHRMAHCRRPHDDDVDRVEQTLRDLEPGANRALRSYVNHWPVRPELVDPIVDDWCRRRHDLSRLIEHGERNKGIDFSLHVARRPWADTTAERVSGTPGFYWVMDIVLHERHLLIDDYLSQSAVRVSMPLIGHIVHTSTNHVFVTFPSVGSPRDISDAIGRCFEAVFTAARPGYGDHYSVRHPWRRVDIDARVDAQDLLSVLAGLNPDDPISIFAAGKYTA